MQILISRLENFNLKNYLLIFNFKRSVYEGTTRLDSASPFYSHAKLKSRNRTPIPNDTPITATGAQMNAPIATTIATTLNIPVSCRAPIKAIQNTIVRTAAVTMSSCPIKPNPSIMFSSRNQN